MIGHDGLSRTFGFAYAAINALVGMYDEYVRALIEAVNGANVDAVDVVAPNAFFCDDVCHTSP